MLATAAAVFKGGIPILTRGVLTVPLGPLGWTLMWQIGCGALLTALVLVRGRAAIWGRFGGAGAERGAPHRTQFVLKDAANRGRLGASTFKALNVGVAVVALTHAANMALWMNAGTLLVTKFTVTKSVVNALLGAVCLFNDAFAKKK